MCFLHIGQSSSSHEHLLQQTTWPQGRNTSETSAARHMEAHRGHFDFRFFDLLTFAFSHFRVRFFAFSLFRFGFFLQALFGFSTLQIVLQGSAKKWLIWVTLLGSRLFVNIHQIQAYGLYFLKTHVDIVASCRELSNYLKKRAITP